MSSRWCVLDHLDQREIRDLKAKLGLKDHVVILVHQGREDPSKYHLCIKNYGITLNKKKFSYLQWTFRTYRN